METWSWSANVGEIRDGTRGRLNARFYLRDAGIGADRISVTTYNEKNLIEL